MKPAETRRGGAAFGRRRNATADASRPRRSLMSRLAPYGSLALWAAVIIVFSVWVPDTFPTTANWKIILSDQAISAVVALGLLLPLAAGAYDLSIAGTMSMSVAVVGTLMAKSGWSPAPAILVALLVGVVIGAVNAWIIVKLRVDSFIATLGTSSILTALTYKLLNGTDIFEGIPDSFTKLGQTQFVGIAMPVYYMVAIAIVLYFVTEHTPFGRYLYAIGANREAARLSGLPVGRYLALSLVLSAVFAALSGVVLSAKLGVAPLRAGDPYLLPAFAAVLLGSTQFRPGRVNVLGTLVAIYLLATGVKGLALRYPDNPWIDGVFQGVTLIAAVALSVRAASSRSAFASRPFRQRVRGWRRPGGEERGDQTAPPAEGRP
jgi:ribose transport system permease protein